VLNRLKTGIIGGMLMVTMFVGTLIARHVGLFSTKILNEHNLSTVSWLSFHWE